MTFGYSTSSRKSVSKYQLKIIVLAGGIGEERQVSLQSGQCIRRALDKAGFEATIVDIVPDNLKVLDEIGIDVFFVALHGRFGEDGQLQQILEERGLVYTGSGPEASKLSFDKMASKAEFRAANVLVPQAISFSPNEKLENFKNRIGWSGDKFVVKPIKQGSSVGVTIVSQVDEAFEAARQISDRFGDCMIEQYIHGREITVGILSGEPLPIIEVRPKEGFYNYHSKYVDEQTEYLFDTIGDASLQASIQKMATDCFNSLGCSDFGRVDFILADDGRAYVLEVNTIPGFTTHSLLPKAAARTGVSMEKLCRKVIETTVANKR